MWKNTKWSVREGERVWVRGCRDSFIDGLVLTVSGSSAQVRTGPIVNEYAFCDIMPQGAVKND